MAHLLANMVRQTSTSTGSTTIELNGAARSPYRSFDSVLSDGDTTDAMVVDRGTGDWQAAIYTYSGDVLTFVELIASSTGSQINFAAGLKDVYVAPLAEHVQDLIDRLDELDTGAINAVAYGVDTTLADNYAALQSAFAAATARGGGDVFLPAGVYDFLTAPVVPDNVRLIGAGWEATVIRATGAQVAVLETEAPNNLATYGVENIGLEATSASQLYGLRVRGCENGHYRRIRVSGLTATTGAGWDGTEAAWGFYFTPYTDGGATLRKPINNLLQELYTTDSPNGIKTETIDGTAGGSGGNNNLLIRCYTSGFTNAGFELWGEANTLIGCRSNSANNNVFCFRFMDSVTTVTACDGDSTNGTNIGGAGSDAWGFPNGVRDNANVGMYFADTCSAVVTNPQGNGCRKRLDFESSLAFSKVQILRVSYNKLSSVVGGVPKALITERTADSTLDMADAGDVVRVNVPATPNTLTVPPHSSVPFVKGTEIGVVQYGTGTTTIVPGVGVTIQTKAGLAISARYGRALLLKVLDDVWIASGDLT